MRNYIYTLFTPYRSRAPQLALVVVTMVWGGTFLIVQQALTVSSPLFFVGCRFAAATLAIAAVSLPALRGVTRTDLIAGVAIGGTLALGYGLQTMGLREITSSESGFLTALYVPLVPLLQWAVWRRAPHLMSVLGAGLAFAGLVCFAGGGASNFANGLSYGQTLTLFSALAIAFEIILIGHFSTKVSLQRVTVIQLAFASIFAFSLMPVAGEVSIPEFSWLLLGLAGGGLIILGIVVSELRPKWSVMCKAASRILARRGSQEG